MVATVRLMEDMTQAMEDMIPAMEDMVVGMEDMGMEVLTHLGSIEGNILHREKGAIAIYRNSDRQRGVNRIAEHVRSGTGTARWYGVPWADGATVGNGGFYAQPGKKVPHYGYH
ncbi:hypothetical protein CAPTEDRAFT_197295 [Capitella teleta]|uniref:Uncharacterized protein n=1 Tax=Capitella teleta TaxID=283909 RepID=R7TNZ2_CAPTE|nr:hypothetical protein CAPTEDRAFT_197295 [Capitella teleta]|eukprot:ELT95344.1 hypothetical protein CAPTEDRAFT_197295 [Capitella teleta]